MNEFWREYKSWIVVAGIALVALLTWNGHSNRVSMRQGVLAANAEIQNQFQRRADLVPNLVRTVEGVSNFEKSVIVGVTEARAKATQIQLRAEDLTDPVKLKAFQDAQAQLSGALGRLIATVENYPALKATANYRDLQAQLEGTENRIAEARGRQVRAVQAYNTSLETLTGGFYRSAFGFRTYAQFEAEPGTNRPPVVEFKKG